MQIESSTKFRGGWENKDNQEHYQPAPGVQALGARGEYMPGGEGQPPPLHPESVSIFICELARSLSRAPENPRRWSSSAFKNGGKWKLDICSDVCS